MPKRFSAESSLSPVVRPASSSLGSCRVACNIAGVSSLALVDTGASRSCISLTFANSLKCVIERAPCDLKLSNASGCECKVSGTVKCTVLFPNCARLDFVFVVVDDLSTDVILGYDFLLSHSAVIDTNSATLTVGDTKIPILGSSKIDINSLHQDKLDTLLTQYTQLFDGKPSVTHLVEHNIDTQNAAPSIAYRRLWSPAEIAEIDKQLDEMLADGRIEKSNSNWSSQIVLVRKSDGTWRFAIDYRGVNTRTVPDRTPLPLIQELLDKLSGAKYFSTLDLKSGFWQIPLSQKDKHKTAFVTHRGLFHFKVMPFGLINAPATFQSLMNHVLHDLIQQGKVCVYIDDILIWSKTVDEHLHIIEEVFARLKDANLKLNIKKCKFFNDSVKFLGHIISFNSVRADPAKVAAITQFPQPTSSKELRRFLGLASFLRRYIPNFASVTAPLYSLVDKQKSDFKFDHSHVFAFQSINQCISNAVILHLPDFSRPFIVSADASDTAIGAMLSQEYWVNGVKEQYPIAFASRKLRDAETRYHTTDKEGLALFWASHEFRHYLHGAETVFLTDHSALTHMRTTPRPSARVQRWLIWLEQFNFSIKHVAGSSQVVADCLSRAPPDIATRDFEEVAFPSTNSLCAITDEYVFPPQSRINVIDISSDCTIPLNVIRDLQLSDPIFGSILQQLIRSRFRSRPVSNNVSARRLASRFRNIREKNGVFYFFVNNKYLLLLPSSLRSEVLHYMHSAPTAAHLGLHATTERVKSSFFWPTLGRDVRAFVLACEACGKAKSAHFRTAAPLQSLPASRPLEFVSIDFMSLPQTSRGYNGVVVFTDLFTKWADAFAVRDHSAQTTSSCLLEFISRYGIPDCILTDQGGEFEADLSQRIYSRLGINKLRTSPYHPQCDGQAERMNRSLLSMLRTVADGRIFDWDCFLQQVLYAYRSATHSSTGFSPYEMLYGRVPRIPGHIIVSEMLEDRTTPRTHITKLQGILKKHWHDASARLDEARRRQKQYYDRYTATRSFEVDDLVWIQSPPRTSKMQPRYHGPFTVVRKMANGVNYEIQRQDGSKFISNVSRMKPAHRLEPWMDRVPINQASATNETVVRSPDASETVSNNHNAVENQPTASNAHSDSECEPEISNTDRRFPARRVRRPYRPGLVDTDTALRGDLFHVKSHVRSHSKVLLFVIVISILILFLLM